MSGRDDAFCEPNPIAGIIGYPESGLDVRSAQGSRFFIDFAETIRVAQWISSSSISNTRSAFGGIAGGEP